MLQAFEEVRTGEITVKDPDFHAKRDSHVVRQPVEEIQPTRDENEVEAALGESARVGRTQPLRSTGNQRPGAVALSESPVIPYRGSSTRLSHQPSEHTEAGPSCLWLAPTVPKIDPRLEES